MNSFKVFAIGNLARNPEVVTKAEKTLTRFCLVGNDFAGRDDEGNAREAVTSVWFTAFNGAGEAIAKYARKGDQLIVEAHVRANIWTDKQGEKQYDHSYIVDGFRFGQKGRVSREEQERHEEEE
jgi:single-strand DNA-binding protein